MRPSQNPRSRSARAIRVGGAVRDHRACALESPVCTLGNREGDLLSALSQSAWASLLRKQPQTQEESRRRMQRADPAALQRYWQPNDAAIGLSRFALAYASHRES